MKEARQRGGATEVTPHKDLQRQDAPDPADKSKRQQERDLDEALMETFPSSDPIAPGQVTGTEPPPRKP